MSSRYFFHRLGKPSVLTYSPANSSLLLSQMLANVCFQIGLMFYGAFFMKSIEAGTGIHRWNLPFQRIEGVRHVSICLLVSNSGLWEEWDKSAERTSSG